MYNYMYVIIIYKNSVSVLLIAELPEKYDMLYLTITKRDKHEQISTREGV